MFFSVITKNSNWEILPKNLVTFKRWGKTLIFWGFTEKSNFGGVHEKPNIEGGLPKKGGLGQFVDLRGAWQERGVVFLRGG